MFTDKGLWSGRGTQLPSSGHRGGGVVVPGASCFHPSPGAWWAALGRAERFTSIGTHLPSSIGRTLARCSSASDDATSPLDTRTWTRSRGSVDRYPVSG